VDNIRVLKLGGRTCLPQKEFNIAFVAGEFRGKNFDGYYFVCGILPRRINGTHAALAYLRQDSAARESGAY